MTLKVLIPHADKFLRISRERIYLIAEYVRILEALHVSGAKYQKEKKELFVAADDEDMDRVYDAMIDLQRRIDENENEASAYGRLHLELRRTDEGRD